MLPNEFIPFNERLILSFDFVTVIISGFHLNFDVSLIESLVSSNQVFMANQIHVFSI